MKAKAENKCVLIQFILWKTYAQFINLNITFTVKYNFASTMVNAVFQNNILIIPIIYTWKMFITSGY